MLVDVDLALVGVMEGSVRVGVCSNQDLWFRQIYVDFSQSRLMRADRNTYQLMKTRKFPFTSYCRKGRYRCSSVEITMCHLVRMILRYILDTVSLHYICFQL